MGVFDVFLMHCYQRGHQQLILGSTLFLLMVRHFICKQYKIDNNQRLELIAAIYVCVCIFTHVEIYTVCVNVCTVCVYITIFFVMLTINMLIMQQAVANNILETKYLALLLSV